MCVSYQLLITILICQIATPAICTIVTIWKQYLVQSFTSLPKIPRHYWHRLGKSIKRSTWKIWRPGILRVLLRLRSFAQRCRRNSRKRIPPTHSTSHETDTVYNDLQIWLIYFLEPRKELQIYVYRYLMDDFFVLWELRKVWHPPSTWIRCDEKTRTDIGLRHSTMNSGH